MMQLSEERAWEVVDLELERIADLLEELNEDQWNALSLCEGWRVRHVAAHLVSRELTTAQILGKALRYLGNVDKAIDAGARDVSNRFTDLEVVEQLREMIGHRVVNKFVTPHDVMVEALVHGLDIAVPLGVDLEQPQDAMIAAIERMIKAAGSMKGKTQGGGVSLAKVTLRATDADWSHESTDPDAEVVEGTLAGLLLYVTGRSPRKPR